MGGGGPSSSAAAGAAAAAVVVDDVDDCVEEVDGDAVVEVAAPAATRVSPWFKTREV